MIFLLAGLAAGFLGGLFGVGGGILLIPLFVYLFDAPGSIIMHMAVGTSLMLVFPISLAASWKQWRMGNLDLRYLRTWSISIAAGVIVGTLALPYFTTHILESIFIGCLLLVAAYVAFAKERWVLLSAPPRGIAKSIAALFVGFWSVLLGLGGGVLTTPIMRVCSAPLIRAIALASATGVIVGFGGGIGAIFNGYVHWTAFALMLPTVLLMAPLGAWAADRLHTIALRIIYALFLLAMAIYMLYHKPKNFHHREPKPSQITMLATETRKPMRHQVRTST